MDIDLWEDNDFELSVPYSAWDGSCTFGKRIYVPNTEYGGIIRETESITGDREIYARGYTWRGMLQKKILRPESGQDYLTASGELNTIIKSLVEETLPGLFYAETEDTGKGVSGTNLTSTAPCWMDWRICWHLWDISCGSNTSRQRPLDM